MVKKNVRMEPKIESFKLSQLKETAYNPRTITDEAMAGLTSSIKKFGCVEPIVVNTRGGKKTIIGGHQRFKALKKLHTPSYKCTCVTVWLSASEEKLLNLTLNNPQLQGQFIAELAEYIDTLRLQISDRSYVDLRIGDLREDLGDTEKIGLTDDDEIPPPPAKPKTWPGQIWELGRHRLLCGDSTKAEDVLALMKRRKARMCFTSPPYNMAADMYENYKDNLKSQAYINFNLLVAANVKKVLKGFLFWNLSYNTNARWEYLEIFCGLIKKCEFTFLEQIIWDKEKAMPITSTTGLTRQHENILLLTNQDIGHELDICFVGTTERTWAFNKKSQRGVSNYWRIPVKDNTQLENHKACFPVALAAKAIGLMSRTGEIVIEPFCGSGTTIIAAEKLGRICYAIEKDPVYCDVTVKRWEAWTGKKAKLLKRTRGARRK